VLLFGIVTLWLMLSFTIFKNNYNRKRSKEIEHKLIDSIVLNYKYLGVETKNNKLNWVKEYINTEDGFWNFSFIFVKVHNVAKATKGTTFRAMANNIGLIMSLTNKLKSNNWYTRGKSIWLTYELELSDNWKTIIPHRNDKNKLVRREAQIALVTFLGWKSLVFFPYAEFPISLWQQIRIIDKLKSYYPTPDLSYLDKALKSKNPFIKELLIRIIRSYKLNDYKWYIIEQLHSNRIDLTECAIEVLNSFEISSEEILQVYRKLEITTNTEQYEMISDFVSQYKYQELLKITPCTTS